MLILIFISRPFPNILQWEYLYFYDQKDYFFHRFITSYFKKHTQDGQRSGVGNSGVLKYPILEKSPGFLLCLFEDS